MIEDFGPVRIEDQTLSANVSFEEDRGGNTTPGSGDGTSDEGDSDDGLLGSVASGIRGLLSGTGAAAARADRRGHPVGWRPAHPQTFSVKSADMPGEAMSTTLIRSSSKATDQSIVRVKRTGVWHETGQQSGKKARS